MQFFTVFVFYEYEYNNIFINIVITQNYFFLKWYDVSEWEKLLFFKHKIMTKFGYDVFYT